MIHVHTNESRTITFNIIYSFTALFSFAGLRMQSLFWALIVLVSCDCALCLFYTSSKENDYPRFGKRNSRIHSDAWMDKDSIEDYNEIIDSSEIKPTQYLSQTKLRMLKRGTNLLFQFLDRNGRSYSVHHELKQIA